MTDGQKTHYSFVSDLPFREMHFSWSEFTNRISELQEEEARLRPASRTARWKAAPNGA